MDINPPVSEIADLQNTPSSVNPATESQENKKSTKIPVLFIIVILLSILTLPIPYYQTEQVFCKPGQTNCPQPGWHLNPSILQSIIASRSSSSTSARVQPAPSPTPVPDPTENWKTYSNTRYQYSIRYPNNWTANSIGPGIGTIPLNDKQRGLLLSPLSQTPVNGMSIPIEDIHIQIEVDSRQTSGETFEEWTNTTKKNLGDTTISITESKIASFKTTVVKTGFKIIYLLSSPDKTKFIFIETQTPNYEYREIIDQILSTFKFTDEQSSVENSLMKTSWTTYIDKDINFELQYPEGWTLRKTYGVSINNLGNYRVSGVDITTNLSVGSTLVVNIIDPKGESFSNWIKLYSGETNPPAMPNSTYKNIPAYRFERFRDGRPAEILTYYMPNEKYIVFFASNTSLADQETANQILSTFKFLN